VPSVQEAAEWIFNHAQLFSHEEYGGELVSEEHQHDLTKLLLLNGMTAFLVGTNYVAKGEAQRLFPELMSCLRQLIRQKGDEELGFPAHIYLNSLEQVGKGWSVFWESEG